MPRFLDNKICVCDKRSCMTDKKKKKQPVSNVCVLGLLIVKLPRLRTALTGERDRGALMYMQPLITKINCDE